MPVYPGDVTPTLRQIATVGTEGFSDFQLTSSMHVGTHIDAPAHMIDGGKNLLEVEPSQFFGRGVLIDARNISLITAEVLHGARLRAGDIVLVNTGWSVYFGQPRYYEDFPKVETSFADVLIAAGVSAAGFDSPSPDTAPFATHKKLLGHGILIIENLVNLERLLGVGEFEVVALPVKFAADGGLARVVARVPA